MDKSVVVLLYNCLCELFVIVRCFPMLGCNIITHIGVVLGIEKLNVVAFAIFTYIFVYQENILQKNSKN